MLSAMESETHEQMSLDIESTRTPDAIEQHKKKLLVDSESITNQSDHKTIAGPEERHGQGPQGSLEASVEHVPAIGTSTVSARSTASSGASPVATALVEPNVAQKETIATTTTNANSNLSNNTTTATTASTATTTTTNTTNNTTNTANTPAHAVTSTGSINTSSNAVSSPNESKQSPLVREQLRFCSNVLKGLKRHPQSHPFHLPVDPVALNIPDYLTVIKEPMDLSTIAKKLESNAYEAADAFIADVRLMLQNCSAYNAPETQVYAMGKSLEKYFENTISKMPTELTITHHQTPNSTGQETPKRRKSDVSNVPTGSRPKRDSITPKRSSTSTPASGGVRSVKRGSTEITFCNNVLREILKKTNAHLAWPFMEPVDPIRLGIPDYFEVIKHPMDLTTIRKRLEGGQYSAADQFEADFRLMLNNCFTYNAPDSDVVQLGKGLEAVFDKKWSQKSTSMMNSRAYGSASVGGGGGVGGGGSSGAGHVVDDDDDSDSEKILSLNRKIQALQQELNELLMKRKRRGGTSTSSSAHHTSTKPASKPRTPKTPSASGGGGGASLSQLLTTPMTFDEKRQLSIDVNDLSPEKLGRVVEIIHASMPNLKQDADSEVIELDIESLDLRTLRELQKYVHECKIAAGILPAGTPLPGTASMLKKRKVGGSTGQQPKKAATGGEGNAGTPLASAVVNNNEVAKPSMHNLSDSDDSGSSSSDDDLA